MKMMLLVLLVLMSASPVLAQPECPPPGAVDLVYFRVVPRGSAIVLEWETAQELNNLGFNIYASQGEYGEKVKINLDLIPARYPGTVMGAEYFFIDGLRQGRYYWLEDLDDEGVSTFHGPVSVRWRIRIDLTRPRPEVRRFDG